KAQAYPPLLVTAGLNDPRVTYWEPAKWVARLRELKTDDNLLLLKTNMGAGHGGKSGRFESLRETAEEFAFILWQMGAGVGAPGAIERCARFFVRWVPSFRGNDDGGGVATPNDEELACEHLCHRQQLVAQFLRHRRIRHAPGVDVETRRQIWIGAHGFLPAKL